VTQNGTPAPATTPRFVAVELMEKGIPSGKYRLVVESVGADGRQHVVGLCSHGHDSRHEAVMCADAAASLDQSQYRVDEQVTDLRNRVAAWISEYKRVGEMRRFSGVTHTSLEEFAGVLLAELFQKFLLPS
jgi:hypothetical protein